MKPSVRVMMAVKHLEVKNALFSVSAPGVQANIA
jgi:hypothetical protein